MNNISQKKICFVLPVHPMFSMGGAELQGYYIACEFAKMGYKVTFISQNLGNPNNNFCNEKIYVWKIKKDSSMRLANVKKIYSALKAIDADIYYQRIGGIYTGTCSYYCQKYKKKMIWACSSDKECFLSRAYEDVQNTQWYSKGTILKKLYGLFHAMCTDAFRNYGIKHADICIAQSQKQKQLLKTNFNINAEVIKNGYYAERRIKVDKKKIVLWVANIRPLKNPDLFIKLVNDINQPDWTFIMIGAPSSDYKWMNSLYTQIEKVSNLKYVGFQSLENVENYFAKSSIFINTSDYEGFPNTYIQAWLNYTAVISLFVDPDDIIKNNRIGKVSNSYEQLLSDTKELINNSKLRKKIAANAYKYVIDNHSIVLNARQLECVVNKK